MVTKLEAKELSFAYPGPVPALHDVSVSVTGGELLCVLGPNGAGKSTLLKCLAGLLVADRGEVRLGDRTLGSLAPRERARQLAVVPQFLPALPDVGVLDFALGGRYAHRSGWRRLRHEDLTRTRQALADCDVLDLAERSMTELSGGQRQRIAIARALAQEAEILLVDEPTHSLDPAHQIGVFELLRRQVEAGRAVLVVTHDLNLAAQYATRVVLLAAGRVVTSGSVEEVFRPPVLGEVYGPDLHYGRLGEGEQGARPFVLPRRPPAREGAGHPEP